MLGSLKDLQQYPSQNKAMNIWQLRRKLPHCTPKGNMHVSAAIDRESVCFLIQDIAHGVNTHTIKHNFIVQVRAGAAAGAAHIAY